jgi:hypothetical protein
MNIPALEQLFNTLNEALKHNNDATFRSLWHAESYTRNLVGPEGWSGDALFTEAINSGLSLVPELNDIEILEEPNAYLVGCYLKKEEETDDSENNDYCYLLVMPDKISQALYIWGAGSANEAVAGLWNRLSEQPAAASFAQETKQEEAAPIISIEEAAIALIEKINSALDHKNEQNFAGYWLPRAYHHNLCGEGGLSGKEFATQATEGKWQLKAQMQYASVFENPEAILIPCEIWLSALDMPKANDERFLLLVNSNSEIKILGLGVDMSEMRHLYLSYKNEVWK